MKPDIHPKYYPNARVVCACGHTWTTGATQPEIRVDVCSNCHPYYTGEQRIVDTAGRVDRFRMRLAQKREKKVEKPRKEKFRIVGQEVSAEVSKPAPAKVEPEVQPMPAAEVVEQAEAIVSAMVEEPQPTPTAIQAPEPEAPADTEPEYRVRTVVEEPGLAAEGLETEKPMQPEAIAEASAAAEMPAAESVAAETKPKRRPYTSKPRASRPAGQTAPGEKPARKPRTRKAPKPEAEPSAETSKAPVVPEAPVARDEAPNPVNPAPEGSTAGHESPA